MLQIASGKYFRDVPLYEKVHRGTYFTNILFDTDCIDTPIGRLVPSSPSFRPASFSFEITDRLEAINMDGSKSILLATSGHEMITDFSTVISFFLNITCTADLDLTRRLISENRTSLGHYAVPNKYIPRVFDPQIFGRPEEVRHLNSLIAKLISFSRPTFEGVMRSIRQFVNATHRIADNPDLAYTLFVSSVESLCQSFDGYVSDWNDVEARKRLRIDSAVAELTPEAAAKVRAAVLQSEHTALARRFREFSVSNVTSEFFRSEADGIAAPVRRSELAKALDSAYKIRSKYIHNLKPIPMGVADPDLRFEMNHDEGLPILTFAGLHRVCRNIILNFINHQAQVSDDFDYRSALPNIRHVRLASEYWLWSAEGLRKENVNLYFGSLVGQIVAGRTADGRKIISDLSAVAKKIERVVKELRKSDNKIAFVALYFLYGIFIAEEQRPLNFSSFWLEYQDLLSGPSIYAWILHIVLEKQPDWSVSDTENILKLYYDNKFKSGSLDIGPTIETAMNLSLAEQYRKENNFSKLRSIVCFAVENDPSNILLRTLEGQEQSGWQLEIDWRMYVDWTNESQQSSIAGSTAISDHQ